MRAGGNTNRGGISDIGDLSPYISVAIEDLNSFVPAIGDIHIAFRIDCDSVRRVELPRIGSSRSPGFDELAMLIELRDSGVAETVGDIDVPRRVPRHVGRPLKHVALR